MTHAPVEHAKWGEPVSEAELVAAEDQLGARLPEAWRDYLKGEWLRSGRLRSGEWVTLADPAEALDRLDVWHESTVLHPGIYFLGLSDCILYCIDLRDVEPAVQLTGIVSSGWDDAEPLLDSVADFVDAIRAGTFRAYPDDEID